MTTLIATIPAHGRTLNRSLLPMMWRAAATAQPPLSVVPVIINLGFSA